MNPARRVDAVVLAGGRSARLGGRDKVLVEMDGQTLLAIAVQAVAAARAVVVVGPERDVPLPRAVAWAREEPAFGGPVAGLAAGLAALPDDGDDVLLLAADLPHAGRLADALLASRPAQDARVVVDADGRAQWTASLVRRDALVSALHRLGDVDGASLRRLFSDLEWEEVAVPAAATWDVDTPDDLPTPGSTDQQHH